MNSWIPRRLALRPTRDLSCSVAVHRDVVTRSQHEVRGHPAVEVGGKLVGHFHHPRGPAAASDDPVRWLRQLTVTIVDAIDAGPDAIRTPVYHLPNGPYQSAVLGAIRAVDADARLVGSWHSHHPNGLRTLSDGDLSGYRATLADTRFGWPALVTPLVLDDGGLATARWFVILNGVSEPLELSAEAIRIVDGPRPYADAMDRAARRFRTRTTQQDLPRPATARSPSSLDGTGEGQAAGERPVAAVLATRQRLSDVFDLVRPVRSQAGQLGWQVASQTSAGVVHGSVWPWRAQGDEPTVSIKLVAQGAAPGSALSLWCSSERASDPMSLTNAIALVSGAPDEVVEAAEVGLSRPGTELGLRVCVACRRGSWCRRHRSSRRRPGAGRH